jgi:CheY-like chemotaxis protein
MVASPKLTGATPAGAKPARASPAEPDFAGSRASSRNPARGPAVGPAPTIERTGARPQLCFVIDGDASIRQFLSLVLQGSSIDTEEFADSHALRAALAQRMPDIVFLDVRAETTEAAECLAALGAAGYRGPVQLTLSRGATHLTQIQTIGSASSPAVAPIARALRCARPRSISRTVSAACGRRRHRAGI